MFKNLFEMLNSCALVIEISMLFEQIFSLKVVTLILNNNQILKVATNQTFTLH